MENSIEFRPVICAFCGGTIVEKDKFCIVEYENALGQYYPQCMLCFNKELDEDIEPLVLQEK